MALRKGCDTCKYEMVPYDEGPPCTKCCHLAGDQYDLLWEPKTDCKLKNKEEKKMSETLIKDDSVVKRKTKAQLMEELEQKNSEIAALKKELERSENYELFVAAGKEMRDAMDGLVAGGLTEEQAFQVLLAGAQLAAKQKLPNVRI